MNQANRTVVPRADRMSSSLPQPPSYITEYVKQFEYNPRLIRGQYDQFKKENEGKYDFSKTDQVVKAWTPLEELKGAAISGIEGLTWGAVESDYNVGHPVTQFISHMAGGMVPGQKVYKYLGQPIAKKFIRSNLGRESARFLGANAPVSKQYEALKGFLPKLPVPSHVIDQVKKLRLPVTPKNLRTWQGMVGLSVPEALVGGIADGIREESFSEALSSMPYWFIVGILGNSGFKSLNMLWRRKRGERLTAKGTPDEMSGQISDVSKEEVKVVPETTDAPDVAVSERDLEEITGILESQFQEKLGMSMDQFDQVLKDFTPEESDRLLDLVSNTTMGNKKRDIVSKYINDTYSGKHLNESAVERVARNAIKGEKDLINRRLQIAARDEGTAIADAVAVKNMGKSNHALSFLEHKNIIPPEFTKINKETDWTQQPNTPIEVYDGVSDPVISNSHDAFTLESASELYGVKNPRQANEPSASQFLWDEINSNKELQELFWTMRMADEPPSNYFEGYDPKAKTNLEVTEPKDKGVYIDPWRTYRGQLTKKQEREMEKTIGPYTNEDRPEFIIDTGVLKDTGKGGFVGRTSDFKEAKAIFDQRFSQHLDEQRPLVSASRTVATLEAGNPVTTLEDGTVFKGTPQDYKKTLQDEIKEVNNVGVGHPSYSSVLNSMTTFDIVSRWLSNVHPSFSENDSYFKNIKLIDESNSSGVKSRIGDSEDSIQLGFTGTEPVLVIDETKLMASYSILKPTQFESFKAYKDDQISFFYDKLKRKDVEGGDSFNYQKDLTESVDESKVPVISSNEVTGEVFLHNNVKVIDDPNSPKAGTYNRESQEITVNSSLIDKKFEERAWTTPSMQGVKAFERDAFETPDEWKDFVLEHEYLHHEFSFDDFKKVWTGMSKEAFDKPAVEPTIADYENFINSSAYLKVTGREFGIPQPLIKALREALGLSKEFDELKKQIGDDEAVDKVVDSVLRNQDKTKLDRTELAKEKIKKGAKSYNERARAKALGFRDDIEPIFGEEDFNDLFNLPFKHSESDRRAFEAGVLPDDLDLNAQAHDLIKEKIVEMVQALASIDNKVFNTEHIPKNLTNSQALYITDILQERITTAGHLAMDAMMDNIDDIALSGTLVRKADIKKSGEDPELKLERGEGRAISHDPDQEVIVGAEVLKDELKDQPTTWFGYNMEWLMGSDKWYGIAKNRYVRDFYVRYVQDQQTQMGSKQEEFLNKYFEIRRLLGAPKKSSIRNTADKVAVLLGRETQTNKAEQKLYTLAKYLDQDYTEGNNPLAKVPDELKADPNTYQAFILYRELMDDVANLLKLPKDKRISGYLAHIFSGKAGRLVGGKVAQQSGNPHITDLVRALDEKVNTDGKSLDEVLDALEAVMDEGIKGTGYRGLIKREGKENYTYDLDSITLAVIYGSTQKDFTHKIAKRANDILSNLPYTIKNKFGSNVTNPMRKAIAKHARHLMGKPTSQREYIAQLYSDSNIFNRGVDKLVELIGGAPEGLNLSMPKNAVQTDLDNEMRKKSIEWLDDLERVARTQDFQTGKPTGNFQKSPMKFFRASIALQIQDLRNALNNRHLSGPVANSIYRGMIVGKLGLNLSHALINLTQIINTASKLEMTYVKRGLADTMFKGNTKIHGRSIKSIVDESGIKRDVTSTEEFMGMRPSFLKDVQEKVLIGSRASETFNREVCLLGAYRKFRDLEMTHGQALNKARVLVNETQHTFDRSGTPPFLRGPMMRLIMMFSSYTVHQTAFTVDLAQQVGKQAIRLKKENDWVTRKALWEALKTDDGKALLKFSTGTAGLVAGALGSDYYLDTNITGKVIPPMLSLPANVIKETGRRGLMGSMLESSTGPAGDLATHLVDGTESGVGYVYWMLMNHSRNAHDSSEKMWKNYSNVATAFVPSSLKKTWNGKNWMQIAGLQNIKRPSKRKKIGGFINSSTLDSNWNRSIK